MERALSYGVNVPRIDLAIDDRKPYFRIADLARLAREGKAITKMRIGDSHVGFDMGTSKKRGDTLYVGSRSSEFFICFYEKGYEQAEKLDLDTVDEDWNRYELRFRQKRAVNLAKELVKRRDVAVVAMEVLNQAIRFVEKPEGSNDMKIRRYPLWEPWGDFMRDIGKCNLYVAPEWKDYYDRLAWLETQVAPTLKAYQMIDERMGTHTIDSMLERTRLDKKHHWIVDSCVKQLEAERQEGLKIEKQYRDRLELYERGFIDYDGFRTPFDIE